MTRQPQKTYRPKIPSKLRFEIAILSSPPVSPIDDSHTDLQDLVFSKADVDFDHFDSFLEEDDEEACKGWTRASQLPSPIENIEAIIEYDAISGIPYL